MYVVKRDDTDCSWVVHFRRGRNVTNADAGYRGLNEGANRFVLPLLLRVIRRSTLRDNLLGEGPGNPSPGRRVEGHAGDPPALGRAVRITSASGLSHCLVQKRDRAGPGIGGSFGPEGVRVGRVFKAVPGSVVAL